MIAQNNDWQAASVFIFDVEGTLVDAALPTLFCWQETLGAHGLTANIPDLHVLFGMDGNRMLRSLFPHLSSSQRSTILADQGQRFRRQVLPGIQAFPGVAELFRHLKSERRKIALATDCQQDELHHYIALTGIEEFVDAVACGSDVCQGKPDPGLVKLALARAGGSSGVMIGDTPYDARGASAAGLSAVGVQTGGFSAEQLRTAGCIAVLPIVTAMPSIRSISQQA